MEQNNTTQPTVFCEDAELRLCIASNAVAAIKALSEAKRTISGAESCTGGLIQAALTAVPGSSEVVLGGIVSYSEEIKQKLIGVRNTTILKHGVVSEEVAKEMVVGTARALGNDLAYSVTGVAGPGGETEETPVGTVCFGFYNRGNVTTITEHFTGDRDTVRLKAAVYVLNTIPVLA